MFLGDNNKIVSLLTSYVTNLFNKNLENFFNIIQDNNKNEEKNFSESIDKFIVKMKANKLNTRIFNTKVLLFNSKENCLNHLQELNKNNAYFSKLNFIGCFFDTKEVNKKNINDIIQVINNEKNQSWDNIEETYKYGTIFKLEDSNFKSYSEELKFSKKNLKLLF